MVIDSPSLNILAAYQTESVAGFFMNKRNVVSGLVGRFSPVFADPNAYVINGYPDKQFIRDCLGLFKKLIQLILSRNAIINGRKMFGIASDAKQKLLEFSNLSKQIAGTSHDSCRSFILKNAGRAVRLACTISILSKDVKETISLKDMEAAINICDILMNHANFASGPNGLVSVEAAKKIETNFKASNTHLFDYRTAKQWLNSNKYSPESVVAALNYLCLHHHISCIPGEKGAPIFVTHPSLVDSCYFPTEYQYQYQTFIPCRTIHPVSMNDLMPLANPIAVQPLLPQVTSDDRNMIAEQPKFMDFSELAKNKV
jgi:hypothetical protein